MIRWRQITRALARVNGVAYSLVRMSHAGEIGVENAAAAARAGPTEVISAAESASPAEQLLARPDSERTREYRYRLGQAIVFGLPVIALQLCGTRLGGREAARWVAVFQALLAGWVVYVAVAGMLFEGLILLNARRRITLPLLVAGGALGLYLFSLLQVIRLLFGREVGITPWFHWVVALLAAWCAASWWRWVRRGRAGCREGPGGG
jgi:cation transport ATPase